MNEQQAIPLEVYQGRKQALGPGFNPTSLADIMAMKFEPLSWAVEGYLPEGLSILAGRQKLGKTWLALDFAIAVSMGGAAMGSIFCEEGDVLYCDLENGYRRIQGRIQIVAGNHEQKPWLDRLQVATECRPLDKGLIDDLETWRRSVSSPRLVVIDVLQRVKPQGKPGSNSYENDYAALSHLQAWATENRVAVLVLHHTRKGGADDPLEALNGSNGLSACADTTLVLDRDGNGITLYVRGRDVEEKETALRFDGGYWSIMGEAAEVRRSDQRSGIIEALWEADELMNPRDIAVSANLARNSTDQLLMKMVKAGEIIKVKRGWYAHPNRKDLIDP